MQNRPRLYPHHCKCRIHPSETNITGKTCRVCGSIIKSGLPSMRELERQMEEDKAIDRIMVT